MSKLTFLLLLIASIAKAQPNIVQAEYWVDQDPGYGAAIPLTGFAAQPDISSLASIIAFNLPVGLHPVGYRSKDAANQWSQTNFFTVHVTDSSNGEIIQIEYFWNTDPGYGTALDTVLGNPMTDISNGLLYADVPANLSIGSHLLFVRSKDSRSRWSQTNYLSTIQVDTLTTTSTGYTRDGLNVFPNPFSSFINVRATNPQSMRCIVYDAEGRKLFDEVGNQDIELNTERLTAGSYIVFVWVDNRTMYKATMIKQ